MFSAGLVSTLVYTACHDYALQKISVTPFTRTVLCLVFNELMLYWLLFEFRSTLLFYAYFDAGVWNETSVVINIQFPLPNDIDNVKLYCIPWYIDFEARTNMAARR